MIINDINQIILCFSLEFNTETDYSPHGNTVNLKAVNIRLKSNQEGRATTYVPQEGAKHTPHKKNTRKNIKKNQSNL